MIKLGIVSDSHGRDIQLERFEQVCAREKYDVVIHLGDTRDDAKWLERNLPMEVLSVAGNCDPFSKHLRELRLSYENHRMIAVHGDAHGVKYGLERLSYYAEEQNAEIALFGHTHRQFAGYVGNVIMINPGALKDGCYAELLLDGRSITPYERNLNDGK